MNLSLFSDGYDLWGHLSKTNKKILMYGMGNGADKILAVCEKRGIEIQDFFASDGFVRGHSFRGKTVLSYSQAKEKYGADNMIVLLSFASSLPDVLTNIRRIASECELYAPDVPVCADTLFDLSFARANANSLREAYSLLEDDESKHIFENVVYYKLTGRTEYLFDAESNEEEVFLSLLGAKEIRSFADLGAYNGDTVRQLMRYSKKLERVWAFEPDRRSFRKLSEFCDTLGDKPDIIPINAAAWSAEEVLTFGDEGNRNSGLFAKGKAVQIRATSLDSVLEGHSVDYIKYDVEGCEREAIKGSSDTILTHRPKLLVSTYHRSEDIFSLILQIKSLRPDYKLYLRRFPYIPAWDLDLICI